MKEKQTVLIVDDDIVNRILLKRILTGSYNVIEAENGAAAWKTLNEKRMQIAAVLLDVVMPVMSGTELLSRIVGSGMNELPVIMMTGDADRHAEQKALDAGAWDFVIKPINAKILLSRLRNAIARSQISAYERMQHMSEHDNLTGLHNRAKMFANTRAMLDSHPDTRFAVIRIDIDHFALFNSSFGEHEGDCLLCYLAEIIAQNAENYEIRTYGRMMADIFCLCVPYDGDDNKLQRSIDMIQKKLSAYRRDYLLKISAGVCIADDITLSVEELYLRASMGANRCKNQYEVNLAFYDAQQGRRAAEEIVIASEMQNALDTRQFVVYIQPKFELASNSCCGGEALVRWLHPTKGLIPPGDFIPVYESNGFIAKLDYYVWDVTCALLRRWLDRRLKPSPISVNISRVSLYNPQLVRMITDLVKKYELSPSLLRLEITESAYMSNPELMEETLRRLRAAGFTLLIDDFGSGYSSLNTLKNIEVDILKIDMKFLEVSENGERGEIILASVIRMAHWLGMTVVTEGVETNRQRDFLEGIGCDIAQGYFYSKPIPAIDYEKLYVDIPLGDKEKKHSDDKVKNAPAVLVIDDVEVDRMLLCDILSQDYTVTMCATAEEGLAYLYRNLNYIKLII
ncbi:MAG: EAL domain-containing protein, partial [Eubacteriales bacterium]